MWNLASISEEDNAEVVKSEEDAIVLWTLEVRDQGQGLGQRSSRLRAYALTSSSSAQVKDTSTHVRTWRDVTLPSHSSDVINLDRCQPMADGRGNILLADSEGDAVHVMSATSASGDFGDLGGRYEYRLLSRDHGLIRPYSLALDSATNQLYIGQPHGHVFVFQLFYSRN